MIVSAIVAVSQNGFIGKDNQIPWYLSTDLKYFKKTTLGHHIIMGRKSYDSIGRPLPKRTNLVVSRNPFLAISGCVVVHSVEEALEYAAQRGEEEAFIIGGGMIYTQSQPLWDRLYLTEVHAEVDGDVRFPDWDPNQWDLIFQEDHLPDEKNDHPFSFKIFHRK
jgi:dihydrofolate reductase